jgi:CrcB protein
MRGVLTHPKRVGDAGRMKLLLVLVGGALGAAARYLTSSWMARRFGAAFPWGTLSVNVAGSFLIGLLATLADEAGVISPDPRAFLVVGVLGGFTTFSSFTLETLRLVEQEDRRGALLNVGANLLLGFAAVTLGVLTGRAL